MRWHIVKTLLHKEALRHEANRGGIVLLLLLVACAVLLSFFGSTQATGGLASGVQLCHVDYAASTPLVMHLSNHIPANLAKQVRFDLLANVATNEAHQALYPQNTGAIQIRPAEHGGAFKVWFWHPGEDGAALAQYEAWFWQETLRFYAAKGTPAPEIEIERSRLQGAMDARSGLASSLVLFGLFFVCVYLLPSLTCEEREQGVLLAQALSPASPREILGAKYLFYTGVGLVLGAVLAGLYQPRVLGQVFFWLALTAAVVGSMGVGLTIASLARTQRAASMGALCYLLAVTLLLTICQQADIPGLPYLALEYHCPRMIHAALTGSGDGSHWGHLAGAVALAGAWSVLAVAMFRRHGWQ